MSGRYICFVDAAGERPSSATYRRQPPPGFERLLQGAGVAVFGSTDLRVERPEGEGYAMLGLTFSRQTDRQGQTAQPHSNEAEGLLARRWGAFVGLRLEGNRSLSLVRDPSGQFPCYFRTDHDGLAIASDVDLLRDSGGKSLEIDWQEVGDELLFGNHFSGRTALVGIHELLPGEELSVSPQGWTVRAVWSPWDNVMAPVEDIGVATSRLRAAFTTVHEALSQTFPRPLITVSGGLDSSIVATEIARSTPSAGLISFYTERDALGDERPFAHMVAKSCDARLVEAAYRAPDFETARKTEMFLPRPTHRTIAGLINTRLLDQAFLGGHPAVMGGYGGDNVFCIMAAAYAFGDRLRHGASLSELLSTLRDIKQLTGASYYALARHIARALKRCITRPPNTWPRLPAFLTAETAARRAPARLHPWLMAPDGARPGSTAQVAALINAHVYLERFARTTMVTNLSPLLLAPVVETCLAIPTWLWCAGGKDRAPARMAATNLPPDITRRKSKGSPLQMHAQYFDTHREALKQFLCDGLLAENGIVDRTAVDRYCSLPPPVRDLDYLRLLELVDAEIWCRYQVDQRR